MHYGFNQLKLSGLFKKMKREWQSKIVKEKREVQKISKDVQDKWVEIQ